MNPRGDALPLVWKALADPTRRRLLDLLRERPLTTGELAAKFSMTRYAVMKHLDVLTHADLVFVRREGRQRWNHLNAVPIQQIYRRWIRPFETVAADALLRLKALAEQPDEGEAMTQATKAVLQAFDTQMEIAIAAPPEKVWKSLTEQTSAWWPKDFYVGGTPRGFLMEPRVGGRVYEDWGDDQGVLWATILIFNRNVQLQWVGDLSPEFGGPARSITSFTLEATDEGTRVKFRDSPYGQIAESVTKSLEEGWMFLLKDCLKPFVEEGTQPERPESVTD